MLACCLSGCLGQWTLFGGEKAANGKRKRLDQLGGSELVFTIDRMQFHMEGQPFVSFVTLDALE